MVRDEVAFLFGLTVYWCAPTKQGRDDSSGLARDSVIDIGYWFLWCIPNYVPTE